MIQDLAAPFSTDQLLEVRVGKMKPMKGLKVESGIDKKTCDGSVFVNKMGIVGDEHDYTFHGGVDKAVHGYCSAHYASWKEEFPSAADRFVPGGFGENFVTAHMNERNVCIGDIIAVGDELRLQVSLPRQPCFKLNQRFELKNFAPNTWKLSRTGWYYRVLREGHVKAGDEIRLVERGWPKWTIERIQEYLHRNQTDPAMNEELAAIEPLGAESRNAFKRRVAKQQKKDRKEEKEAPKWREFRIVEKKQQTPRIASIVFEAVEPLDEADPSEGEHAKIKLPNGLVRTYSIVDGDKNKFQLAVALDENSRGGSKCLHETVKVGDTVPVGPMTAGIPMVPSASNHVFVAGGIGITAFLSVVEVLIKYNISAVLHYAVRSADETPFKERLEKIRDHVHIYDKSKGQRMVLRDIVTTMPWNSHLYFCGPGRLMEEAQREVAAAGIPETEVHYEAFSADLTGDPFEVVVARQGGEKTLKVGGEETLLEVLQREFGDDIPSSCEVGNCGTCKINLKEGRVDHRGTALAEEEKATSMLACVSRGIGRIAVEV
ncbi:MOSC domain-containing protein [Thozetella sp. PMI_491]|nr:MOSC domain-containing protein [Thozetella sp. PMI_491]